MHVTEDQKLGCRITMSQNEAALLREHSKWAEDEFNRVCSVAKELEANLSKTPVTPTIKKVLSHTETCRIVYVKPAMRGIDPYLLVEVSVVKDAMDQPIWTHAGDVQREAAMSQLICKLVSGVTDINLIKDY